MTNFEEINTDAVTLGLTLATQQGMTLAAFLHLLSKWNKIFSLTSISEKDWTRLHILDSLSVMPHLTGNRLVDVGSGAGFPGIPLAILRPEWSVTLVESNRKKVSFLTQAVLELELRNVTIHPGRVEDFAVAANFDTVISRAFADLSTFVRLAGHLCGYSGKIAAMKAAISSTEIDQLDGMFEVEKIIPLKSVDSNLKRTLILLQKARIPASKLSI